MSVTSSSSAAFDVAAGKVGRDLAEAISPPPNNTYRFAEVAPLGVDGAARPDARRLGRYLTEVVDGVAGAVRRRRRRPCARPAPMSLVSYLPVGSEQAARWYAEQALEAGCAFVNCIPVFIASRPGLARGGSRSAGCRSIGDDIKCQVGATIVHRVLANLFRERGVRLDRTYQLNFGGNTDFLNMLERERLESKKISKTQAVTSQLGQPLPPRRRPCRPERPRALADRPQMVLHPAWRGRPSATCR